MGSEVSEKQQKATYAYMQARKTLAGGFSQSTADTTGSLQEQTTFDRSLDRSLMGFEGSSVRDRSLMPFSFSQEDSVDQAMSSARKRLSLSDQDPFRYCDSPEMVEHR